MAAPLRKVRKPRVKNANSGTFCVRLGTVNERQPATCYNRLAKARDAARAAVEKWEPWCTRHNSAGLTAIANAKLEIDLFTPSSPSTTIDVLIDEHTHLMIRIELWNSNEGA